MNLIIFLIRMYLLICFRELTEEDLLLLCDLFYLPFEHGPLSVQYLTEFNWLKSNAHLVSNENQLKFKKNGSSESKPEVSTSVLHFYFCSIKDLQNMCYYQD